ncbi:hypothetical protein NMG60_11016287 [Bertholletia excelsa]
MAARSDFAQKLLSDLRLRKERMAAASQGSNNSPRMAGADTYGNPSKSYKGSRQIKALESVGSRPGSSQRRSKTGTRSLDIQQSNNQLVPLGGGRNSNGIGDLSMALAFALENGGRLIKLDSSGNGSVLSFLHQNRRRKSNVDMSMLPSQFISLSHLHVKEISKGAQKLNQILRAFSNGMNFDRYSIEVARELMKGAMDLEESLKMLVNLQEASEYMVSPQRKNRIRLLDEDDDEEDGTIGAAEQRLVSRPRFSFDNIASNSQRNKRTAKNDHLQNLLALTYPIQASSISSKPGVTSSSQPKPGKGRISNVIAKLMGLEELPQSVHSKSTMKDSGSKQKEQMGSQKIAPARAANANTRTICTENSEHIGKKPTPANKIKQTQDVQVTRNATKSIVADGKLLKKDLPGAEKISGSDSRKASVVVDKRQSSSVLMHQFTENQNLQGQRYIAQHKEQIGRESRESKQPVVKDDLRKHKSPEAQEISQKKRGVKEILLNREKINAERLSLRNQQKALIDHARHQKKVLQNSEPREEKHPGEKREQKHVQESLQVNKQKGIERPPARGLRIVNQEALVRSGSSTNSNSHQSAAQREEGSESENSKGRIPEVKGDKIMSALRSKTGQMKVRTTESPVKKDEVITRKNRTTPRDSARPLKHQSLVLQEMKSRRLEKTSSLKRAGEMSGRIPKEAEVRNMGHKKAEASITLLNGALASNEEPEQAPNLSSSGKDEPCQEIALKTSAVHIDSQYQTAVLSKDQTWDLKSQETISSPSPGTDGGSKEIPSLSQVEPKEFFIPDTKEKLTENETHLKQILIKSQLFLNTAEALFKLHINASLLHNIDCSGQEEDSKLYLDCAYEIMKRKGRRQELTLYPCLNISIVSIKVSSLDDLVKQLRSHFEKLKFYGKNGSNGHEHGEDLYKMIERDVQNIDPDANSMWELGWQELMFATDGKEAVSEDVEKHLLNGLLDEITNDLLQLSAAN